MVELKTLMNYDSFKVDEEILQKYAYTDIMTGLFNRNCLETLRPFFDSIDEFPTLYVAIVDVDGLKSINDTYGHEIGDTLIKSVASKLSKYARFVFRLGGDEFLLVDDEDFCIYNIGGVSTGYSHRWTVATISDIMKDADENMYLEKKHHHEQRAVHN